MILHRAVKAALLTLCLLVLSPLTVVAQNQPAPTTAPAATSPAPTAASPVPPPANASPAPTTASNQKLLKPEELDALVAPIALYPDNLLSLMLMASTYPIEIV